MTNLKNITELPVAESAEGLNLIVNDNGSAKQIAASAVGGAQSWNSLKDKPFYDTREYGENVVTFDGDITGKDVIETDGGEYFVKVSDKNPTKEELIGASASAYVNGQTNTIEIIEDMIEDAADGSFVIGGMCIIVPVETTIDSFTLSPGIWVACLIQNGVAIAYASELSWYGITSGELKQIEEKYLPAEEWDFDVNITVSWSADDSAMVHSYTINSSNFESCKNKIINGIQPKMKISWYEQAGQSTDAPSTYGIPQSLIYILPAGMSGEDSPEAIAFNLKALTYEITLLLLPDNTITDVT